MVDPPYRIKNMMPGMIMLWFGAIVDIPSGWHLCDGTVGTPDLRNKFIPCAGDTYNPGDAGGADSQTHTFTGDGHIHPFTGPPPPQIQSPNPTTTFAMAWVTGTTDAANNRPQYYALCYIMKL